jgi:hypothetical protein
MHSRNVIQVFFRQHLPALSILILLAFVIASGWIFWNETTPPKPVRCKPSAQTTPIPSATSDEKKLVLPYLANPATGLNDFTALDLASRTGFGLSTQADAARWSQELHAAWYIDWDIRLTRNFNQPEHWQMVRLSSGCISPSIDFIRWAAMHYPGQVWIIGNEPDVKEQDAITPEEYAYDYQILSQLIKTADPTARIAVAGVAQGTPLRLAYLDGVLEAYRKSTRAAMPVDWWTLHGYVLREERGSWGVGIPTGLSDQKGQLYEIADHNNLALFAKQIADFRAWMKARGYQNTPLALTEFGILMPPEYGFSPEVVASYLRDTFQWLAGTADAQTGMPQDHYHLVQRWAWFSLADVIYPVADLVDLKNEQLTPAGKAFHDFMYNPSK